MKAPNGWIEKLDFWSDAVMVFAMFACAIFAGVAFMFSWPVTSGVWFGAAVAFLLYALRILESMNEKLRAKIADVTAEIDAMEDHGL